MNRSQAIKFNTINLIPQKNQDQRQNQLWMKRWGLIFCTTIVCVVLPAVYIAHNGAIGQASILDEIEYAEIQIANHQATIPQLRAQFLGAEEKDRVYQVMDLRVRWRDVFSILVTNAGSQVRFMSLKAEGGGVHSDRPVYVVLEGIAGSQSVARSFIVRVESEGVFDRVEMLETQRVEVEGHNLIRFRARVEVRPSNQSGVRSNTLGDAGVNNE